MPTPRLNPTALAAASLIASLALLSACGGGSAADEAAAASDPPVEVAKPQATITGTVADGPLSGVTVCYDLNGDGRCGTGEPVSAATGADGRYSLTIDEALAGKHTIVAEVPATAIDKDTGAAVGVAFTLTAPASGTAGNQSVFVGPLTTLVQVQMATTGGTLAEAAEHVKAQAALPISPLADYTAPAAGQEAASTRAALVARLTMLTWQSKVTALAPALGATDLSGTTVSARDLNSVVVQYLVAQLPAIALAAADPAITQAADGAARTQALTAAAAGISEAAGSLTQTEAVAAVGLSKMPKETTNAASTAAGASLSTFRFVDADNWFFRAFLSSAADNQPDAQGLRSYYDLRSLRSAGTSASWGFGNAREREGDLHWSGSAWVACPLGTRSKTTVRDAAGRAVSNYCDGFETNVTTRSTVDISGKTLRSVAETIRAFPGGTAGVSYADWGPRDLAAFGSNSFPAGSQLHYQTNFNTRAAPAYDARATQALTAYPAAIAAGGDARANSAVPCNAVTSSNGASFRSPVTSLEDMIARNPGVPCQFNPSTTATGSTGAQNDWWSNSSVSLGSVANAASVPAGTGGYYTTTAGLRAAFDTASKTVRYYRCLFRASDGSARNCSLASTGTYTIETLGDARVMRLEGIPPLALQLDSARVFIERDGKVYAGYQIPTGVTSNTVRLNLAAANAVFAALGVPALVP